MWRCRRLVDGREGQGGIDGKGDVSRLPRDSHDAAGARGRWWAERRIINGLRREGGMPEQPGERVREKRAAARWAETRATRQSFGGCRSHQLCLIGANCRILIDD